MFGFKYYDIILFMGNALAFARLSIVLAFYSPNGKKLKLKEHRYLKTYAIVAFLIALFESVFLFIADKYYLNIKDVLTALEIENSFFVSPFYFLNELLFLGLAFNYATHNHLHKKWFFATIVIVVSEIFNTVLIEGYKDSQTIGSVATSCFIMALCINFLRVNFKQKIKKQNQIFKQISTAMLLEAGLSILIYFFTKYLFDGDTRLYYQISIFRMFVQILCFFWVSRTIVKG